MFCELKAESQEKEELLQDIINITLTITGQQTEEDLQLLVTKLHIERWNSKGHSGYSFDSIYKIYFAAFLHRSFEVIQM